MSKELLIVSAVVILLVGAYLLTKRNKPLRQRINAIDAGVDPGVWVLRGDSCKQVVARYQMEPSDYGHIIGYPIGLPVDPANKMDIWIQPGTPELFMLEGQLFSEYGKNNRVALNRLYDMIPYGNTNNLLPLTSGNPVFQSLASYNKECQAK